MSDFKRCPICHEWGWLNDTTFLRHTCKPEWECRPEWYGNDDDAWSIVHAVDAETAAEKCAETYDCDGGEYAIVSNKMRDEAIIQVRKPGDEEFERWAIEAEAVPTYRATKIDAPLVTSRHQLSETTHPTTKEGS